MGNLKFLSLLLCVVVASVDFASSLKCYRCIYSEPFLPELEATASAAGFNYNKECGGENQNGADLVINPAPITPAQLPNTTTSFLSKLVISALTKVPSPKVLLGQIKAQKSENVNGASTSSGSAKLVENCMKASIKIDTAKFIEASGAQKPPGVEIPAEILTLARDFATDQVAVNQCFTMSDMPGPTQTELKNMGVKDLQLCECNDKDGCNGGKVDMGDGGGGGGAGEDGGASTISLGIFSTIFAIFMYATTC